jgi:hypothetical protein
MRAMRKSVLTQLTLSRLSGERDCPAGIVTIMPDLEPTVEELRRRESASEQAERAELADAETDAEADTHRRRADKAAYLADKLEQQKRADEDA